MDRLTDRSIDWLIDWLIDCGPLNNISAMPSRIPRERENKGKIRLAKLNPSTQQATTTQITMNVLYDPLSRQSVSSFKLNL